MMQGNIYAVPKSHELLQSMAIVFRFQLQLSVGGSNSESGESSESEPPSKSLFRSFQVILVDHDAINRAVTKKLLEKLGCNVTAISSVFECLSLLGSPGISICIVLLDLHMPEMDCFEVAMRIRKFDSRNWPLIIALTSSANEDLSKNVCRWE